jgi:hypothetical protein
MNISVAKEISLRTSSSTFYNKVFFYKYGYLHEYFYQSKQYHLFYVKESNFLYRV